MYKRYVTASTSAVPYFHTREVNAKNVGIAYRIEKLLVRSRLQSVENGASGYGPSKGKQVGYSRPKCEESCRNPAEIDGVCRKNGRPQGVEVGEYCQQRNGGYSSDGVGNGFERLLHASLPETSEAGMAISVNHLMGVGNGRGTPVGDAVDADEDARDDGDGDGVSVSVGGSDGTSESLKCETADRTSSRNLKRAPFSGWVDYKIHPLSDNRARGNTLACSPLRSRNGPRCSLAYLRHLEMRLARHIQHLLIISENVGQASRTRHTEKEGEEGEKENG